LLAGQALEAGAETLDAAQAGGVAPLDPPQSAYAGRRDRNDYH
jgi:hypothetical protein